MSDLIDQAEQNVVNIAKELSDVLHTFDALSTFGNKYLKSYDNSEYFEGLTKMRNNVYRRYTEAITDCFILVGVGGKAAEEYSRERFNELFDEKETYEILHLLDHYGHIPSSYSIDVETQLRKDAEKRKNK